MSDETRIFSIGIVVGLAAGLMLSLPLRTITERPSSNLTMKNAINDSYKISELAHRLEISLQLIDKDFKKIDEISK